MIERARSGSVQLTSKRHAEMRTRFKCLVVRYMEKTMADMKYINHENLNIVELIPVGDVQIKDILRYGNELLDKGLMKQDTIEYVDMSNMTNLSVDYNSSHQLITLHEEWLNCGWYGSVYYTPELFQLGIINMVGAVIKSQPDVKLPDGIMYPSREKIPISSVRDFLSCHLNT